MNTQIEVLVIVRPSRFRDSIHLLLASMSPIEKIHLADDIESAFKIVETPAVVVVDADVDGPRVLATINKIKIAWPQAGLIIMVENEQEFVEAQASNVDDLLRKGFPAVRFIEAVEQMIAKVTFKNTSGDKTDE